MRFSILGFFILAGTAALILEGCSKSDSNPAAPGSVLQIWPLAKGNRWTLDRYDYDSRTGQLEWAGMETFRIEDDTLLDGVLWYEGSGSEAGFSLMANLAEGCWIPRTATFFPPTNPSPSPGGRFPASRTNYGTTPGICGSCFDCRRESVRCAKSTFSGIPTTDRW